MEQTNQHMDREVLTHNLLWLRKKHGYSQKTMAQIMGIGVTSLRRLERGELPPRLTIDCLPPGLSAFSYQTVGAVHSMAGMKKSPASGWKRGIRNLSSGAPR